MLTGARIQDGNPARNAAKNALTHNAHILQYQFKSATSYNRDIFATDTVISTGGNSKKRIVEAGQTRLDFGNT